MCPRILFVEEKLMLGGCNLPTEIKVHAFAGGIGHVWVADTLGRRSRSYSAEMRPLAVRDTVYPREEQELPDSPAIRALIRQAIGVAPRLLGRLDYARIDFMVAGGRLYFGEYTLYPGGGYDRWLDPTLTERAEALWDLRNAHFLRKAHRGPVRLYADALRAAIATPSHSHSHGLSPMMGSVIETKSGTVAGWIPRCSYSRVQATVAMAIA